ncbi:hypothetical protein M5X11_08035 [Paenibacillus alginolyticus]|uniref:hypothetical protein n=1 Tax=Paenibacillus alginolyticus TaxID=59839 RepID=UPI000418D7CA|nr:hypothetical protein [Paenibacillus alginolyticus]MCY9664906.1 hypothetical protein [Paenibacillus alginolyticus]
MAKIIRQPERPVGKCPGAIIDVTEEIKTSLKGRPYKAITFSMVVEFQNFLLNVTQSMPMMWGDRDLLAKLAKNLGVYPEIGEEFRIEELFYEPIMIDFEEKEYNSKLYSNVIEMQELENIRPNPLLKNWLSEQKELRSKAESIFDDGEVEEKIVGENSPKALAGHESPFDENAEDSDQQDEASSSKPPLTGPRSGFPIKKRVLNPQNPNQSRNKNYNTDEDDDSPLNF